MPALELCLALLMLTTSPIVRAQAIQDSRCYLMNGGAVESFFISEDTTVGTVIGTLSINGDPSVEEGDITLRLQEKGAAVGIVPGTKNLTLLRALDREEKLGPSNVYVNVRCDRRRTADPSFIIPVSVRVWDVNDNAPVWQVLEQRVRLSELTAVGTRVPATLRATDADQPGPHATLHYSVLPGPYSDYLEFPNELESVVVVRKPLDYERVRNFTVLVRAQDQGSPPLFSDSTLHVLVLDADDQNPAFSHDHYSSVLPDDAVEGTILTTSPSPISAADQDLGINAPLQYSTTGDNKQLVKIDRDTGKVVVTKELLDELDQPITIVIKASQVDNPDRYALTTLTVSQGAGTVKGSTVGSRVRVRGVQFSRAQYNTTISEAAPTGTVLATLTTHHQHQNPLQFYVSDRSFLDKFAINSAGEVILRRPLDYETADSYQYQVMVTDSITNDTASINITVLNANEWEPRFRFPQYEFLVEQPLSGAVDEEGHSLVPVGKLEVYDGDKSDTVTLTLRGSDASMLYINNTGEMFLREHMLSSLNSSVLHVVATAVDSGSPPRQTSVPVIVHVGNRSGGAGAAGVVSGGVGAGLLVAVFGAAVCALLLLVCALLLHMYRVRSRSKPSGPAQNKTSGFVNHEKPRSPPTSTPPGLSPPGPAPASAAAPLPACSSSSLLSVSAGASTILANSNSSLDLRADTLPSNGLHTNSTLAGQSQRFSRGKVVPLPAGAGSAGGGVGADGIGGVGGTSLMSDHLQQGGAGRSGVAWPCGTIPARVKTLSWDEPGERNTRLQGSRENSPIHDATNPALADHVNLTVYF